MKNLRLLLVLILLILFSNQAIFAETTTDYTKEADVLNSLGLFNGTNNGYELERVPKRVEAAAMLVRLLGAEEEAKEMNYKHPFNDVPEWANTIVGYMYEKGYTKGIGDNKFGSDQVMIARDYSTFMLRALGYGDSDFNYQEALNFAADKGIMSLEEAVNFQEQEFKRNEMVLISYRTLKVPVKNGAKLLAEKLVDNNVITAQAASDAGVVKYEVLPIEIIKQGSGFKLNYFFTKLSPELYKEYYSESGSNSILNFEDPDFLAKYTMLTDYEKKEFSTEKDKVEDWLNNTYYPNDYMIHTFCGEDKILSNYIILPRNLGEGKYNLAIQPVSDELRNLILEKENEFRIYKAEKEKLIKVIPSKAYNITQSEGKYFITIDASKLPESLKNAKYYGASGGDVGGGSLDGTIDGTLHKYFISEDAYRFDQDAFFKDGEPFEIYYYGNVTFTLFDENEDLIGLTVINVE